MRQRVFATVFALAVLACAAQASSAAANVRVTVTPSTGRQRTTFVVRFRAPDATGISATVRSHYQVSAVGNKGKRCTASASVGIGPTAPGEKVRAKLTPKHVWCVGKFHGTILEISRSVCGPPLTQIVCPVIEIAPVTVARFSFRVKRSAKARSTPPAAGPTFAGLQRVTTCQPLPPDVVRALPVQRIVELFWNPASDPDTPSSQIVYDVYYSATSGGENFSTPTWTSPPGATNMAVAVTGLGPAYFVVRARDKAGRDDHNTVQRVALDICAASPG